MTELSYPTNQIFSGTMVTQLWHQPSQENELVDCIFPFP